MTNFKKAALELKESDIALEMCGYREKDGYRAILHDIEKALETSKPSSISVDAYWKQEKNSCIQKLFKGPQRCTARQFVLDLAAHDGDKKSLSAYDLAYGIFHLYGEQWREDWVPLFAEQGAPYSPVDKIRIVGAPLLDPSSDAALRSKSLILLHSLVAYVKGQPPTEPLASLSPSIDFFWDAQDPEVFKHFLHISYRDFITWDPKKQAEAFRNAVNMRFPDAATAEELFKFLNRQEAIRFTEECFRKDIKASLTLFEQVALPYFRAREDYAEIHSEESKFFPNLPQDTPYLERQKLIDDFLGTPVLVLKTNFWESVNKAARTTLKKYLWKGSTEIFSIESGNPGPTTLVFSPHFHENNPRKMFHWIKDLPLQSGRVLFIPEANRALGLMGGPTNPMNRLFDKALTEDRIDYLIVRRVEYLMGLVDGMVGLHDAYQGPFYISDLVMKDKSGKPMKSGPVASPWLPEEVKNIQDIQPETSVGESLLPQTQWQVAEFSRRKLQLLYGEEFRFNPEVIDDANSHSANSATGYMNFHLDKPAMTFEGRKGKEHGQLHAMALYSLLLAFGHKIDPRFEKALQNPFPEVDPKIYQGLPLTAPPAKRQP